MKMPVQVYGILFAFSLSILVLPQILNYAICYRQCNSVAMYFVDVVEVYDGLEERIIYEKKLEMSKRYPTMEIEINRVIIDQQYVSYRVVCKKKLSFSILKLDITVQAEKQSKRIVDWRSE